MKILAACLLFTSAALGAVLQLPTARSGRATTLENLLRAPGTVVAFHFEPVGRLDGARGASVDIAAVRAINRVSKTSQVGARIVLNEELQLFIDATEFEALQGLLRDLPLYEKSAPATTGVDASVARVVTHGGLFIDLEVDGGTPGTLVLSAEKDDGSVISARLPSGAYGEFTTLIENAKSAAQRLL
ncbi:MAG TPA: hypothetical protein VGD81_03345 [Opitutaceae bacterium]